MNQELKAVNFFTALSFMCADLKPIFFVVIFIGKVSSELSLLLLSGIEVSLLRCLLVLANGFVSGCLKNVFVFEIAAEGSSRIAAT